MKMSDERFITNDSLLPTTFYIRVRIVVDLLIRSVPSLSAVLFEVPATVLG